MTLCRCSFALCSEHEHDVVGKKTSPYNGHFCYVGVLLYGVLGIVKAVGRNPVIMLDDFVM